MNRIVATAEAVIQFCIRKAGKPFMLWLVVFYLGYSVIKPAEYGVYSIPILYEVKATAVQLWTFLQFIVGGHPALNGDTVFQLDDLRREDGWLLTVARLIGTWIIFLISTAVILSVSLWIVRFVWGRIPRPFFAWLRSIFSRKGGRFARRGEVAALTKPDGAAFGHYRGAPLMLSTDKHILIMASTRSGKGTALIIPHLLRYAGSAFVLDPKGENARATHRQRRKLNDKVLFLDPFGISGQPQARFNPLSRFTLENMEAESKALAAALVLTRGDHWTGSAQQLLASFIMFVFVSDKFVPDDKDLRTVRRLLLGDVAGTLANMEQSKIAGGLLADLARSFQKTPPNEFGSIVSTAQRETEILDNPFIARCLSASGEGEEVDFSAWHSGTMTVYLCLAAPKFPVFNRWLRLVLTAALDEMTDRLNPPALPVCFMLDELATLGHLATVENAVGLAAGYGVQLFCVFQDTAQMRDLYKGRWASFIGNAGIRALFNLDDYDTAEYWSKFIGSHEVESRSQTRDAFGILQSQSSSQAIRPSLPPEEIMLRYASGTMLVLRQGSRPIEAARVPYFQDATLAGLWDDPRPPPQPATHEAAPVAA